MLEYAAINIKILAENALTVLSNVAINSSYFFNISSTFNSNSTFHGCAVHISSIE